MIWSHEVALNKYHIPRVAVRCFSISSLVTKRIFHLFIATKIRYKQDMLTIEISTIEKLIRSRGNVIAHEKKKLTDAANGKVPLPKMLVDILNAIAARQSNIIYSKSNFTISTDH